MLFLAHIALYTLRLLYMTSTLFVSCIAIVVLYRLFLHPLAGVPGPSLAAVSNIWHAYHLRNGRMLELGKTLHKQYGPVVRVGPNEVWFDSKEAFKVIYGAQGFEKSDFYIITALNKPKLDWRLRLHFPDTLDLLSERDMKRYRLQRRLIGPVYQTSNVKKHESAIDDILGKIIAQIKALQGAEVDLKQWMHIIVVECLGAACLSWSPGLLKAKSDGGSSEHGQLSWRRRGVFGLFPVAAMAQGYSRTFSWAFAGVWGVRHTTPKGYKPFFTGVYRKISRRIKVLKDPRGSNITYKDITADLIQLHRDRPEFTELYLHRMAMTNFGAGHETTCSALTAVMAMIGSHSAVQARVAAEVRETTDATTFDTAVRLTYTQASIKEAQRLYPVMGISLPRTVPNGGLHLHDTYIPAGTTVGCSPVALHRSPEIFGDDAEDYNPERWIGGDEVRAMERFNLTWGGGPRTCPGRHLAELIVYKVVSALVNEFDLEVSMPPDEEFQYYTLAMLSGVTAKFLPKETGKAGSVSSKETAQGMI